MRTHLPPWVKANELEKYAWHKIHYENSNFLIVFVGRTGSGKSYAAQKFAWEMDRAIDFSPRFNIDRVVFKAHDYLDLINSNLPKGSFIVFDEVGSTGEINARTWYSRINKLISFTNQLFRYKNFGVCFTVPSLEYIDNQVRKLMHCQVIMINTTRTTGLSHGKWEWLRPSPYSSKIYHPHPRIRRKDLDVYTIPLWHKVRKVHFGLPPKEMVKAYELKKREMSDKHLILYNEELKAIEKLSYGRAAVSSGGGGENTTNLLDDLKSKPDLLKQAFNSTSGKIDSSLLHLLYCDDTGKTLLGINKAVGVAKLLNKEINEGRIVL